MTDANLEITTEDLLAQARGNATVFGQPDVRTRDRIEKGVFVPWGARG
jgi:hypothetical protein